MKDLLKALKKQLVILNEAKLLVFESDYRNRFLKILLFILNEIICFMILKIKIHLQLKKRYKKMA